jgi:hypothetical protein
MRFADFDPSILIRASAFASLSCSASVGVKTILFKTQDNFAG